MFTRAVTTLLFLSTSAVAAGSNLVSFTKASPGDVIQLVYVEGNCLGGAIEAYQIDFDKAKTGLASVVSRLSPSSSTDKITEDPEYIFDHSKKTPLKYMSISANESAELEQLLAFYRLPHSNGCTAIDGVSIRQFRNGKLIAKETFMDDSCIFRSGEKRSSLSRIIRKARGQE